MWKQCTGSTRMQMDEWKGIARPYLQCRLLRDGLPMCGTCQCPCSRPEG